MVLENALTEKVFQRNIIDALVEGDGYVERTAQTDYNPVLAMDIQMLLGFLNRTQPEDMEKLQAIHNGNAEATILNRIGAKIGQIGLIRTLWEGVDLDGGVNLDLVHPRPTALFDKRAQALYAENKLSVMEEVYHKEGERIDLVIFLNGIAIFTIELKCNTSASGSYLNAIKQYREERDCTTRLLTPKVGALAHFAMDLNEVYVCAELKGRESRFLPFNQGQPEGDKRHNVCGGNPHSESGPATSYMWEDIWTKETIFDLLYDFIYLETLTVKGRRVGERPIFPRFQQLRAVRYVSSEALRTPVMRNYLIEHSAGSGKTKTISWLAHKLSSLYAPGKTDLMYSKVIIVTDRKVVDRQLQAAVRDMAKDSGIVRVMDEGTHASDLEAALQGGYRIIVTTMQKFLYLDPAAFSNAEQRFAVIIDEAHGSTSGKTIASVNAALSDAEENGALDELGAFISTDIARSSRQSNVTMIGFTATPTGKTLHMFGKLNDKGEYEAHDLYAMRQAIDEGFILDVTSNYTTYDSYCRVVKAIDDDPELEGRKARRQIAHLISTHDGTISGNLNVMVEHFTGTVASVLNGKAKAMIVTAGREEAVRYFLAFQKLRKANMQKMGHIQALVAFTDKIVVDGNTYTEANLNGFSDDKTAEKFDTDEYRIMIVADKYQTGFDQPKLCAMYVDKNISGITAVQTLSRLNRMYYEKRVFVLDFRNSFEDITAAFEPYYESTVLKSPLTLSDVRATKRLLDDLGILDPDDVREFNELLAKSKKSGQVTNRMWALLDKSKRLVEAMDEERSEEARRIIRNFIKQYGFLLQVAPFEDQCMHMDYNFCVSLIRELHPGNGGGANLSLAGKVRLEDFDVEKTGTHENEGLSSNPEVGVTKGTGKGLTEDQREKLSKIIADWNARYQKSFDADVAAGTVLSVQAMLEKDEKVKQSAAVNEKKEFANTLDDRMSDALVAGYEHNQDLYGFLLDNEEARRQLLHVVIDDIFNNIRSAT